MKEKNHAGHPGPTRLSNTPYGRFGNDSLILRDELAIDRTVLANERTLLAYLRSAAALFIAGLTIINLAPAGWFRMVGIISLPASLVTAGFGLWRYSKMAASISLVRRRTSHGDANPAS